MSRVRDSQRQKCYNWQNRELRTPHTTKMSLTQAEDLVAQICNDYQVRVPKVEAYRSRQWYGQAFGSYLIKLSTLGGINLGTVIHETAHIIVSSWHLKYGYTPGNYFEGAGGHGPHFMRVFLQLLKQYAGEDHEDSALRAKLKVAHEHSCVAPDPVAHWAQYSLMAASTAVLPVPVVRHKEDRGHHYYCMHCRTVLARPEIKFCSYKQAIKWLADHGIRLPRSMTYEEAATFINEQTVDWVWYPGDRQWYNGTTGESIYC